MSRYTDESFTEPPTQSHVLERPKSRMSPGESPSTSWERATSTNSDTSILDLDALCKQLNEHNSRNEVAWALLRQQQRSVSSKQAHDVAAAARFRLRLNQTGPDGVKEPVSPTARSKTEYPQRLRRSLSTETVSSLTGNRLTRTKDSQSVLRKRKVTRPPPLRLDSLTADPQETQSAVLPARTSSKNAMRDYFPRREEMPLQRRATIAGTEHDTQRPHDQFPPRTASKAAILTPATQAPPRTTSKVAIPTSTMQTPTRTTSKATILRPTMQALPPTAILTATNQPSSTPSSPTEDQLRREIELALVEKGDKTRGEQQRSRKIAQMLSAEVRNELTRTATITAATTKATINAAPEQETTELTTISVAAPAISIPPSIPANTPTETPTPMTALEPIVTRRTPSPPVAELTPDVSPTDTSAPSNKSSLRRNKSLFGWLQKKSEVDELIELYMNDEQLEEEPKRRPSKARLGIFRSKSGGQVNSPQEV